MKQQHAVFTLGRLVCRHCYSSHAVIHLLGRLVGGAAAPPSPGSSFSFSDS